MKKGGCPSCGATGVLKRNFTINGAAPHEMCASCRGSGVHVKKDGLHPMSFIDDELSARGWSRFDIARMISPDDPDLELFKIDLYSQEIPNCRGGELLPRLSKIFGVDGEFFKNLENSWLDEA